MTSRARGRGGGGVAVCASFDTSKPCALAAGAHNTLLTLLSGQWLVCMCVYQALELPWTQGSEHTGGIRYGIGLQAVSDSLGLPTLRVVCVCGGGATDRLSADC
jgi:hypothetical protein